ncbi:selenoprotein L isoform X1 [Hemiscyllium ocellatum]|uniref:selenoprotein L isoform X1 n=1 Tax=Hemiscyllium ocellatum TaxID=170820 RepID=UPI0029677ABA|nr:selenoprotein L isoform X1 [Hemiscyllium ocellatum]
MELEPQPEHGTAEEQLLRALSELSRAGRTILAGAKADSCGGGGAAAVEVLQEFVSRKIGRMAGMIHLYVNFLNSLHVHKRSEAEDLWETFYHSASVRDHVEDLMQFELEWNNFLSEVDARLKTNCFHAQLKLGTQVPMHMTFTDVRSGREVRFEEILQHRKKLLLVLLRHFA